MKHHPSTLGFAATMILLGACDSETPASPPPPVGFPDGFEERVTSAMAGAIAAVNVPGLSVHVYHPEHGEWDGTVGVASLAGEPLQAQHRSRAGSLLKTAIAVAVLQRVERGELALQDTLDARIDAALASRVPNADRITMAMLLSHRSGIADWVHEGTRARIVADPTHVWTIEEQLDAIEGLGPVFEPGASFGYSNTNYNLLGEVLEGLSGEDWRTIVEQDVFARAGMSHTVLPDPGDPSCDTCARGYVQIEGQPQDVTEIDPSMAGAAGGHALVTTPGDLSLLLRAVLGGDVFEDPATLSSMMDFGPAQNEPGIDEYGLGLIRSHYNGLEVIGHLGITAGYQSFNLYLPEQGYYVSAFVNESIGEGFFQVGPPVLDAIAR